MAQRDVLAGAGGVLLGAARTDHAGRRAVLVVRGEEDTTEFTDLAKTMGIDIVDVVKQRGREDPRTYLGRGRWTSRDVLRSAPHGHAWHGVDLVLMHTNATPRQLVAPRRCWVSKSGTACACCWPCSRPTPLRLKPERRSASRGFGPTEPSSVN